MITFTFRCLNKSKQGMLLEMVGGEQTPPRLFSWKECEGMVETDDPYHFKYTLTEAEEKFYVEQCARLDWLVPHIPTILMATKNPNILSLRMLGIVSQDYLKQFPGMSYDDFLNDVNMLKSTLGGLK